MLQKPFVIGIVLLILSFSFYSCSTYQSVTGYFNTYYNAKRLFSDAVTEVGKSAQKDRDTNYFAACKLSQATNDKFDKVIEKSSKIIRDYPRSAWIENTLLMMGESYYYKGESESALRKFKELVNTYPETSLLPEIRLWEAKSYYISKKDDEVLRVINEHLSEIETAGNEDISLQFLLLKGQVFFDRSEYDSAAVTYSQAMMITGDEDLLAIGYNQLAKSYERLGKFVDAEAAYANAVELNSNASQIFRAKLQEGIMLSKSEKYPAAMEIYEDLKNERLKPEEFALLNLEIANSSFAMGDTGRAFDLYRMIDTTYKRTEAAAKGEYMRGLYSENIYFNYNEAKTYYDKAKTEFPAADITTDAARRSTYLTSYLKLYTNLALYDSLQLQTIHPDDGDSSKNTDSGFVATQKIPDTVSASVRDSSLQDHPIIQKATEELKNTIVPQSQSSEREKTYIVGTWSTDRECLWNIAKKKDIYDNPWMWTKIWQRNRDKIKNPDIIKPKWVLKIPDIVASVQSDTVPADQTQGKFVPDTVLKITEVNHLPKKTDSSATQNYEPPAEMENLREPEVRRDSTVPPPANSLTEIKRDSLTDKKFANEPSPKSHEERVDSIHGGGKGKDSLAMLKLKPPPAAVKLSPDSLRSLIARTKFELAGLLHIEMNLPDSAIYWYTQVVDSFPTSSYVPRSYYAMSEIYRSWEDSVVVDSIYKIILTKYDTTQYAQQVRKNLGLVGSGGELDSGATYYQRAEELLSSEQYREAIGWFESIPAKFPLSPYAPKALYTVGWIYETVFVQNDTATELYKKLIKTYPSTIYSEDVKGKVAVRDDPKSVSKYVKVNEIQPTIKTTPKKTVAKEKVKGAKEIIPEEGGKDQNMDEEETPPEDEESISPEDEPDTTDEDEDDGGG
jgi:tetratricopeptide (TPR) repeat protein